MPDVSTRMAGLRERVHGRWTPLREQRVWERISRRREARRQPSLVLALAFASVAVLALVLWRVAGRGPASEQIAAEPSVQTLVDGSSISWLAPGSKLETLEDGPLGTRLLMRAGAARFEVNPRGRRPFEVRAGEVVIEVVGTAFRVALEGRGVRVSVEHGRVRVRTPAASRELVAGEQALFEQFPTAASVPSAAPRSSAAQSELSAQSVRSWRSAAQDGDYKTALKLLDAEGPGAVRDDPADLLLASDAARLGGRPDRAVRWLEQVGTQHAGSSLAPLAAFTLGRVLLEQLGRPREAAQAFARAQRLAPGGALAEDALAREVESWARAGDQALARQLAGQYEKRFPKGRRLKAVRAHAGIESAAGGAGAR